jgi:hypothetical protein
MYAWRNTNYHLKAWWFIYSVGYPIAFTRTNSFFQQSTFMDFTWYSEYTATFSLNTTHRLIFVTEIHVFYEAWTELWNSVLERNIMRHSVFRIQYRFTSGTYFSRLRVTFSKTTNVLNPWTFRKALLFWKIRKNRIDKYPSTFIF